MIDELTMLRDARPVTDDPEPLVLLRARRSLLRTTLARRSRRRVVRALAAGSAAVIALGVVGVVSWGGADTGASAAATTVLNLSARAVVEPPAPSPGPGQYAYTRRLQTEWFYGPVDRAGQAPSVAHQASRTTETWVPSDPGNRLIVRSTEHTDESGLTGYQPAPDGSDVQVYSESASRPTLYRSYSTDPDAMLEALRKLGAAGDNHGDEAVLSHIEDILFDPLAGPGLRAAAIRAMTRIDGVRIVDDDAELGDRHGVAIARSGDLSQVVFDRDSGAYLGSRGVAPTSAAWAGPDHATFINTVVETRIVDDAPSP